MHLSSNLLNRKFGYHHLRHQHHVTNLMGNKFLSNVLVLSYNIMTYQDALGFPAHSSQHIVPLIGLNRYKRRIPRKDIHFQALTLQPCLRLTIWLKKLQIQLLTNHYHHRVFVLLNTCKKQYLRLRLQLEFHQMNLQRTTILLALLV